MRIVIDLQGAQTESRYRGIGRYSLSLAQAIVRNRGDHEIIIALNNLFPDTIEPIRAAFDDLLPQENIRVWNAPGPVSECEPRNTWRREAAKLIREAFLASLQPDVVHITSLFEGYVDDAVTSIGRFDHTTPVSVSLYDLIPLLNQDHYLKSNPPYEEYYLQKIDHLRRASLLLAISESSCQEGLTHLGLPSELIVNILGAADPHFRPLSLSEEQAQILQDKFGLTRPFVLYTGGYDKRKNLPRLIRAYALLSAELRNAHQLVFVGKIPEANIFQLQKEAKSAGLRSDELVFTGYVNEDELVQLYNLCKLYAFSSWHEGFGLPALEAMSCGAPVIGSKTSSLPEVIGREDALFDPFSEEAITEKLAQVLSNEAFRLELKQYGLKQAKKFSWDKSATRAIAAYEHLHAEYQQRMVSEEFPARRLKLAYISPLPPERSGISDYSAELLPELSRHYDIDVIVAQDSASDPWINANCSIKEADWFRSHASRYDRVLYHFGNSPFHQHMFNLLEEIPGVVVMHDFFLSGIVAHMDIHGCTPNGWATELYRGHGYKAEQERFHVKDPVDVIAKYPCNLSVLRRAQGIIVHSENSRQLAKQWYGSHKEEDWAVIPLLRAPALECDRAKARDALSLNADAFVVCSFGLLHPTKQNHRLLDAWLASGLAKHKNSVLIFVGESHRGEYGQKLLATIKRSGVTKQIHITDWVDLETFRHYLAVADIGIQLRTLSRGETSAAVLDCMNYGLPTIVNANGSIADLPDDAVWKLADRFSDDHLIEALDTLWQDEHRRKQLGMRAREVVLSHHAPRKCADQYFEAIERFHLLSQNSRQSLVHAVAKLDNYQPNDRECIRLAQSIAQNLPDKRSARQLLLDISATCRNDLKTGIERVARALLLELIKAPPEGYRIEPVYLSDADGKWHYRYARAHTLGLLDCPSDNVIDEPIDAQPGDILIGLDLFCERLAESQTYLDHLHRSGVKIHFLVFDLLPVLLPHAFPDGAEKVHANWLKTASRYDGAICISNSVADELANWIKQHGVVTARPCNISWFHLGADIENSIPTYGIPDDVDTILKELRKQTSFLMVGTIEPRKAHSQTLAAFEKLWAQDEQVNLVIVGKQGWMVESLAEKIHKHPENGKRLFWLEDISDECLQKIYAVSTCLIAASEGEGFGLPLIEAAQHKLPIIARDIPVFREVSGGNAFYFNGKEPKKLSDAINIWLALKAEGKEPQSEKIPWLTWKKSAEQLSQVIIPE